MLTNALTSYEQTVLDGYDGKVGEIECKKILQDWFHILRNRHIENPEINYEWSVDDAVSVLEDIRRALWANETEVIRRPTCWAWPNENTLRDRPKQWSKPSPANTDNLSNAVAFYFEFPWLRHDVLDGAIINAFLFSAIAEYQESWRKGELFVRPNVSYELSGGNYSNSLWIALGLTTIGFISRWLLLPLLATLLLFYELPWTGISVGFIWLLYLLIRLVRTPARRREKRKIIAENQSAERAFNAGLKAWKFSNERLVNPSRLKELVVEAEALEISYKPALHTFLDSAIHRDPTILFMRR